LGKWHLIFNRETTSKRTYLGICINVLVLSFLSIIVILVGIGFGKDNAILVDGYGKTYEVY
jgi:hypothetical protein